MGISVYFGVYYLSGIIDSQILGFSIYTSRWTMFMLLGLFISGLTLHLGVLLELSGKHYFPMYSLSFLLSLAAMGTEIYQIISQGFKWIGFELFKEQSFADSVWFFYLGVLFIIISFLLVIFSGGLVFRRKK
jgi:hypothetical protein